MESNNEPKIDPRALDMQMDDDGEPDENEQAVDLAVDKTLEAANKVKDGAKKMGSNIWAGLKKGASSASQKIAERKSKDDAPVAGAAQLTAKANSNEDGSVMTVDKGRSRAAFDLTSSQPMSAPAHLASCEDESSLIEEQGIADDHIGDFQSGDQEVVGNAKQVQPTSVPVKTKTKTKIIPADENESTDEHLNEEAERPATVGNKKSNKAGLFVIGTVLAIGMAVCGYLWLQSGSEEASSNEQTVEARSEPMREFKTPRGAILNERVTAIFGKTWSYGLNNYSISDTGVVTLSVDDRDSVVTFSIEPQESYSPTQLNPRILFVYGDDDYIPMTINYDSIEDVTPKGITVEILEGMFVMLKDKSLIEREMQQPEQEVAKEPLPKSIVEEKVQPAMKGVTVDVKANDESRAQPKPASRKPQTAPGVHRSADRGKSENKVPPKPSEWQDKASADLDAWGKQF
ncbi:hypothetical protein [Stenotrophomonas sp. PS02301]|uniref:hypothetical protein n=1 Tax=Stenotrophomonas sp. PS02301 TaxID=2991427 RepID=UPI00249A6FEC|nr:hypothetical protein [Stenotrophomonas sp. PS02301]